MIKVKFSFPIFSILLVSLLFISSCSSDDDNAGSSNEEPQERVLQLEKSDGSLFQDGEVVTFTEVGVSGARPEDVRLSYFIKNVGQQEINVKIEVAAIRGSDGSLFTFCVQPLCIFDIEEGASYPGNGTLIAPGQINSNDDYFINNDPGDENTTTIEYDMRFYVQDSNGNQYDDLTITYQYNPN